MSINEIRDLLFWSTLINYAILLIWFGVFVFAHDWMYRMHSRWFKLSIETFDAIHYAGIALFKLGVLLLNLTPLLALYFVV